MILGKSRNRKNAGAPAARTAAATPAPVSMPTPTARVQVQAPTAPKRVSGPGFSGIVAEGESWADWINVRSTGEIELYIRWEGHATPRVFLYDQQGTPHQMELRAIENGSTKMIELPLGFTYIAVQNMDIAPRPIRVMTRLPGFTPPLPGAAPAAA